MNNILKRFAFVTILATTNTWAAVVSDFEVQGIKLGMTEEQVMQVFDEQCQKENDPWFYKEEERDRNGIYQYTSMLCRTIGNSGNQLTVWLYGDKVMQVDDFKKINLKNELDSNEKTEMIMQMKDKLLDKYGDANLLAIGEIEDNKLEEAGAILVNGNKYQSHGGDGAEILACWGECDDKQSTKWGKRFNATGKSMVAFIEDVNGTFFKAGRTFKANDINIARMLFDTSAQKAATEDYQKNVKAAEERKKQEASQSAESAISKVNL